MDVLNLIKAPIKWCARKLSDNRYNKDLKANQQKAYDKTGKQLEKAKKQGKYINGSELYNHNLANSMRIPNQKKRRRDKFIDEI